MRKAAIARGLVCLAALALLSGVDPRSAAAGEGPRYWLQTIAGSGRRGAAVDGDARDAVFSDIGGMAFGADGTIYIADSDNGVRYLKDGVVGSIFLREGIDVVYDVAVDGDVLYASATLSLVPGNTTAGTPSFATTWRPAPPSRASSSSAPPATAVRCVGRASTRSPCSGRR